ncbi:MAG TPA: neutral/alkaline non-lysosomal ceramidase N-terminal domain-containing protein [Abditibacteriaceae bacterium]|nr:neutral/alkaline non-lysosomal ceramidase N-terminal domain-containing protein [Abditibacteriaceae bacterium]
MLLGTARALITPPLGVHLAGYGFERKATEVLDELELGAFWFQDEEPDGTSVCIITADIIGFSASLTTALRAELAERFGIAPQAVLLAASHTHSGPQTCENMATAGGPPDPGSVVALRRRLMEAAAAARGALRPVNLRVGRGCLQGYAINRRLMMNGVAVMAPNPEGVRDDEVLVVTCHDRRDDRVRAVLFHYTCHPTLMGDHRITGDYPGAARRHVEKELDGVCVGFLPGCFGDVRPDCVLVGRKAFRRAIPEDVAAFGAALGAEVVRVARAATSSAPLHPRLSAHAATIELPLQKEPERVPLSVQRLDLAEELTLIALGGEICVDYGRFIKSTRAPGFMIPVGYANGMIGYICPARQFAEGGYEPDTSHAVFNLPSPFQPAIEGIIHEAIQDLAQRRF